MMLTAQDRARYRRYTPETLPNAIFVTKTGESADSTPYLSFAWNTLAAEPAGIDVLTLRQGGTAFPGVTVDNFTVTEVIPEPTGMALLGIIGAGLAARRRDRRRRPTVRANLERGRSIRSAPLLLVSSPSQISFADRAARLPREPRAFSRRRQTPSLDAREYGVWRRRLNACSSRVDVSGLDYSDANPITCRTTLRPSARRL